MEIEELILKFSQVLKQPDDFHFPFPPYDIQQDFMSNLYRTIEERKLGIFESPTGTGKSLSVICGSLAWLRDHESREKQALQKASESISSKFDNPETDWIKAQAADLQNQIIQRKLKLLSDKIARKNDYIEEVKKRVNIKTGIKVSKSNIKTETNEDQKEKPECDKLFPDEDEDVMLEEVEENFEQDASSEDEENDEDDYSSVKIIFCSRTHSQLSQFVNEVKRTDYNKDMRVSPLASRQSCCINKAVKSLANISLINEKCLELQKKNKVKKEESKRRKKGSGPCPMLSGAVRLGEEIGTTVTDLEDLVSAGVQRNACPYYASRAAVNFSQLLVVPYNILLHKNTREASGIKLEGNVVIIDEAHNLLETITHIHSVQLSGRNLVQVYSQLNQYKDRYEKQFSAFNLMYLKQLIYVIGCLIKLIGGKPGCGPNEATTKVPDSKVYTLNDFNVAAEIDTFNLYKIIKFCKISKITHKIQGFCAKYSSDVKIHVKTEAKTGMKAFLKEITNKKNPVQPPTPSDVGEKDSQGLEEMSKGESLSKVVSFLECLTSGSGDGRIVVSRQPTIGPAYIKFQLLNPAPTFKDIVDKARSIVVCGGTMEPVSEFQDQLFLACGADVNRVVHYSYSHVVPPDHILPIALASGPSSRQLDFSFQSRAQPAMMNELGRILRNVCSTVPAGIVCFLPSYEYETMVYQHLEKTGIISVISNKKKVFREPKKSSQVDEVLSEYATVIKSANKCASNPINGCLLFSVVGGKLSEGLNFSDDLGRCVIVVGLPYPNIKSPELIEKMSYLDINVGGGAGRKYYEALCMKAVNQCIGRAVRHKADYASVLLLDSRYLKPSVQSQLPAWILRSLQQQQTFGPAIASITKFFKSKGTSNMLVF